MTATAPALIGPTDAETFTVLYHQHRQKVENIIRRIVYAERDREDIAQAAWLLAWRFRHQFKGDCAYLTWVSWIAKNEALTYLRRKRRSLVCYEGDLPIDGIAGVCHLMIDPARDVERVLMDSDLVAALLPVLPSYDLEAIRLVYWDELAYGVAAEILGTNLNHLKTRVFRAKERLRNRAVALSAARRTGGTV